MSERITVPEEYRPHAWASYEIEVNCPKIQKLRITDLNMSKKSGTLTAIFHRPDHEDIYMQYDPEKDVYVYFLLTNYYELRTWNKGMVDLLVNNGLAIYKQKLAEEEHEKINNKYYMPNPAIAASLGLRNEMYDHVEIVREEDPPRN